MLVIPRFSTVWVRKLNRRRGLQQRHLKVGSEHGQGDARDPGAAADVDDRATVGEQVGQRGAVQHVPIPETVDLPGTDDPPLDPG